MAGGFCRLANIGEKEQSYHIEEAFIIECVMNYLIDEKIMLTDYYIKQIQTVKNPSIAGNMMDIFLALAFNDLRLKFTSHDRIFQPNVSSFYYYNTSNTATPLPELLKKDNQYILPKHITGPDGLLRCGNVLYVITCKTTQRQDRSVDLRDVENNFKRTDLRDLFPGRSAEEDELRRKEIRKYIENNIETVVRIHFVFPRPTHNAHFPPTEVLKPLQIKSSKRKHQDQDFNFITQYVFNISLSNLIEYFPQNLVNHLTLLFNNK